MKTLKKLLVAAVLTLSITSCSNEEFCGEVIGYGIINNSTTHILRNSYGETEERIILPINTIYAPGVWVCVD